MTCPFQTVLATHADRELQPEAARQTEAHLLDCARCRELIEALRGESRLLAAVLEAAPARQTAEREAPWVSRVTAALLVFVAAAGVQAAWSWLVTLGEQPIDVVDGRSLVVSALFEALFFLLREGAFMLTSILKIIVAVLLVAAAGAALAFWRRRAPSAIAVAALVVLAASPSFALERRIANKGGVVMIPAGETIDDSLLAAGDTVSVDGVVTGNVLAFGRRVSVRGTVKGDLVTLARRVDVDGKVEGNILDLSEDFTARGPVALSLHAIAKHVGIEREASIQGDAITFSQETDLEGQVGRDVLAFAGLTNLRGNVARNASAWTGRLRVEAPARIGGDLTAHVDKQEQVSVESGATIVGKTVTRLGEKGKISGRGSRYSRPSFYLWKVIWLAAAFLTGLVLQRLLPSLFPSAFGDSAAVGKALGVGFLALAAPPVAVVILALTLVGLPLALLALAVWAAGLYLSKVVVGAPLGRLLLSRRDAPPPPFALALVVGLLAVTVATNIPYVGGIARLIVLLLGLGASVASLTRSWRVHLRPEVAVAD
jgi:cytoskeletal protein CcmA (bactofilin family)